MAGESLSKKPLCNRLTVHRLDPNYAMHIGWCDLESRWRLGWGRSCVSVYRAWHRGNLLDLVVWQSMGFQQEYFHPSLNFGIRMVIPLLLQDFDVFITEI